MMRLIFLSLTISLLFNNYTVSSQDSTIVKEPIKIGIKTTPPFVVEKNGQYSGLSIKSWEMINTNLDFEYEYVSYETLEQLLTAVEKGDVDMSINPITVTVKRMERMDFSQPYFISETVVAKKSESNYISYIKNIISWDFIKAIFVLLAIISLFGFLIWLFERKKNAEEFGGKFKGIAQGFWWSAVTMTTVGYGDKSPITTGGRVIGFIWMFAAIIMISSLTAGIASSLTAKSLKGSVESIHDLDKLNVVTIKGSSAEELLTQFNIDTEKVAHISEAIKMVTSDQADVVVYDKPILTYAINEADLGDVLLVSDKSFKKDYYSYSYKKNSKLKSLIDTSLIGLLKTSEWNSAVDKY